MSLMQRAAAVVVLGGMAWYFWNMQYAEPGTWYHTIGVVVGSILLILIGLGFIPYALSTMGSEATIECPHCEGSGELREGRYVMINGVQSLTYECGGCEGQGTCSNGQFTAGAGCGCLCVLLVGLGASTAYGHFFGEPPPIVKKGGEQNTPQKTAQKTEPHPAAEQPPTAANPETPKQPEPMPAARDPRPSLPTPVDPPGETPPEKNPRVRTWRSADGKFTVEAEFRSMTAGVVKLKRVSDGMEIAVPLEQLAPEDQKWVRDFRLSR